MGGRLSRQYAIVTGGGRGIGKAVAIAFASEGASVCIADVDRQAGEETAREIIRRGGEAISIETDASQPEQAAAMVSQTVQTFGRVDILVNNAAVAKYAPFLEYPLEDWVRSLEINLTGYFLCAQESARMMVSTRRGKIINLSSVTGCVAVPESVAYSSTKGAVDAFTRVLAYELAPYGICVNAIAPGPILTEMARKTLSEEDRRVREAMIPAGRYGETEDLIGAAVFLASKESDYVTGQTIYVDGGFSISGVPSRS